MTKPTRIRRALHDESNPYFMMRRDTAQDKKLSWEARGILSYLLSKSDDWMLQVKDLQRKGCGRDKVYKILDELKSAGYMEREKSFNAKHQIVWGDYLVYETPQIKSSTVETIAGSEPANPFPESQDMDMTRRENPFPEFPDTEFPDTENTELTKYRVLKSTEFREEEGEPQQQIKSSTVETIAGSSRPIDFNGAYVKHDALIAAWAEASGLSGKFNTKQRRDIATEMLEWASPPTPKEVETFVAEKLDTPRKDAYHFRYLLDDLQEWLPIHRKTTADKQRKEEASRKRQEESAAWRANYRKEVLGDLS